MSSHIFLNSLSCETCEFAFNFDFDFDLFLDLFLDLGVDLVDSSTANSFPLSSGRFRIFSTILMTFAALNDEHLARRPPCYLEL